MPNTQALSAQLRKHIVSKPIDSNVAPDYAVGRLLMHHSDAGTWRMDLPSGDLHWSRRTFEIFGQDPDAGPLILADLMARFVQEDRAKVSKLLLESIRRKCGFEYVLRIVRNDRRLRYVECIADVEIDRDGHLKAIVGIMRDVTAFRMREASATARSMILRALLGQIPAGIAVLDRQMRYVAVSDHWASGHGWPDARALLGKVHYDFIAADETMRREHRQVLAGTPLRRQRAFSKDHQGKPIVQDCLMIPWHAEPDRIGGMIIILSEVDPKNLESAHFSRSGLPTSSEFAAILEELSA